MYISLILFSGLTQQWPRPCSDKTVYAQSHVTPSSQQNGCKSETQTQIKFGLCRLFSNILLVYLSLSSYGHFVKKMVMYWPKILVLG